MKTVIFNANTINLLILESYKNNKTNNISFKTDDTDTFCFLKYLPSSKYEQVSDKDEKIRKLIWIFKDNDGKNKMKYDRFNTFIKDKVICYLKKKYKQELKDMIFLCIPAASNEATRKR